jgi:hypothetical protein
MRSLEVFAIHFIYTDMKIFKQVIRIIFLTLIILLASTGMIGIFPNYRDRYMNKKITTELIEKKNDESSKKQE